MKWWKYLLRTFIFVGTFIFAMLPVDAIEVIIFLGGIIATALLFEKMILRLAKNILVSENPKLYDKNKIKK